MSGTETFKVNAYLDKIVVRGPCECHNDSYCDNAIIKEVKNFNERGEEI